MATKIKLDLEPAADFTFPRPIAIPNETGAKLIVTFDFAYRDRKAFAEVQDTFMKRAEEAFEMTQAISKAQAEATEKGEDFTPPKLVDLQAKALERDVEAVMLCARGWNADGLEFNADNVSRFLTRYPGAGMAIVSDYRVSLTEGRLGN